VLNFFYIGKQRNVISVGRMKGMPMSDINGKVV